MTQLDRSPTDPAIVTMLRKHMDGVLDLVSELRARWTDEGKYENIADYFKIITDHVKSLIPEADDIKATKWAVSFKLSNGRWYSYYLSGKVGGWKRIK